MTRLLAAIDNSAAAGPVLRAAIALASVLEVEVEAIHVLEDGDRTARAVAEAAGVKLRIIRGPTVASLADAAQSDDVTAVVLGARGTPGGRRPAGRTALELVTSLGKPVLVVPPELPEGHALQPLLVPLDATLATARAVEETIELACRCDLDVVILHVYEERSLPLFNDQPQHETEAWIREFVARYCPRPIEELRVELRVGQPSEHVLDVATNIHAGVIVLGWAQDLAPGRAHVVREVLARSKVPVLLIPATPSIHRGSWTASRVGAVEKRGIHRQSDSEVV